MSKSYHKSIISISAAIAVLCINAATNAVGYTDWGYKGVITGKQKTGDPLAITWYRLGLGKYNNEYYLYTGSYTNSTGYEVYRFKAPTATVTLTDADISIAISQACTASSAGFSGLSMAPDGSTYLTAHGAYSAAANVFNRTYKVKADGTLDASWQTAGFRDDGATRYGSGDTLADGRLVQNQFLSTNIRVLNTDGSVAGTINGVSGMGSVRAMAVMNDSTIFFMNDYKTVQKMTFDPVNYGNFLTKNTNFYTWDSTLTGGFAGIRCNPADNTVIVASTRTAPTPVTRALTILDADTGAVKQQLTTPAGSFCDVVITPDGATGQYMYVASQATRNIYIYYRATVPVTLSGFELE